ncbi:MAG: DUF2029 domain-containing protein [Chloroflexi bacterium]|nr:DUF2029 domain-containing protein [Chloroflexota bacterium]
MSAGKTPLLFQPIRAPKFLKLFLIILVLLIGVISIFIHPGNLDASDFMLIAWEPGQELLKTGSVYANYPYPLWTVVVMLPLVIWTPKTAILLMFICNMLMLSASLALFMIVFDWELTPVLLALSISLSGFFLPVLSSLWLGQLTVFSLFILALTLYCYLKQYDVWLGIVLGLSFIKPQIMLLLTGLLLVWALSQKKWKVLLGFGGVMLALVSISLPFASSPSQIIGGGIQSHLTDYILFTSTIWGVALTLSWSWLVPLAISITLLLWVGWLWLPLFRGRSPSANRAIFIFSAAVIVNLIAIPYSWMHNLALLLLPAGYSLSLILKMEGRARFAWSVLLFVILHPLMIGLFLLFAIPNATQAYQIIPALFLLLMMIFLEPRSHSMGE